MRLLRLAPLPSVGARGVVVLRFRCVGLVGGEGSPAEEPGYSSTEQVCAPAWVRVAFPTLTFWRVEVYSARKRLTRHPGWGWFSTNNQDYDPAWGRVAFPAAGAFSAPALTKGWCW